MPLLNDELSVWEIGHRWAGYDPDSWRPGIPLPVRDNFRTLMDAILQGHLFCVTISLDKRGNDKETPHLYYIRDDLDAIYHCIQGLRYPRKLLKWARIERWAFQSWCEGYNISLPEFWFPPGWKLLYEWPELRAAAVGTQDQETPSNSELTTQPEQPPDTKEPETAPANPAVNAAPVSTESQEKYRVYERRCIACQEIAKNLWKADPSLTIAALIEHEAIKVLGGGQFNAPEVVRRWIAEVAPPEVKARRGRPRKNPTAPK